jgi:hypothetical protein
MITSSAVRRRTNTVECKRFVSVTGSGALPVMKDAKPHAARLNFWCCQTKGDQSVKERLQEKNGSAQESGGLADGRGYPLHSAV